MNYRKQAISLRRGAEVHRNILLALLTTIFVLVCALGVSSIVASGQSEAAQNSYKYYTSVEIEKGDTLWNIAEQYMSAEYGSIQEYVDEIKEINNLGDDEIHSGQYLTIPYFAQELK